MGGSSSSSTARTTKTSNISQQGEANVNGSRNTTTVYRADALTLDNIAAALAAGVEDLSESGVKQVEAALESNKAVSGQALQFAEEGNQAAMDFVSNFTEREQIGSDGEQLRTLQYVAAAVAVALVGIAWASRGSL